MVVLFEPIALGGVEFRNRLWVPPMCQYMIETEDGVAGDWHVMHLGQLAQGGAGAVILEATGVTADGRISPRDLGLWNDLQRDALVRVVALIHHEGARAGIQLAHAGRKASTFQPWGESRRGSIPLGQGGWETVAPSAIAFTGLATPKALSLDGIEHVVTAFAKAARRALEAGFDLLEVHAAHGYLLHQFLSPASNVRIDEYGGSLAGRARLLLDVVDRIRHEIARSAQPAALIVRLSATDWVEGGWDQDETDEVSRWLGEHGVDLISVSTGGNHAAPDIPVRPHYQVPHASSVRANAGLPVAAVGLITEPARAEQILSEGHADVVLVGREVLRDPRFPFRAAAELGVGVSYRPPQYAQAYAQGT